MDKRLGLISEMVHPCGTAADVGTDHGYLICDLAERGVCRRGIAADIREQPLDKARREIAVRGLGDRVQTVCTDGLNGIGPVDAVILAGMGGELITRIIDRWPHSRSSKATFYLQPMTKAERLRQWLFSQGYAIQAERCCVAAGRSYSVLEAVYMGQAIEYTPIDLYLGAVDPDAGPDELAYCRKVLARLQKKVNGLAAGGMNTAQLGQLRALAAEIERKLAL